MDKVYNKSVDSVLNNLQVSRDGLNSTEVEVRQKQYGYNELKETSKKSVLQVFIEQYKDLLVIILLVSATISLLLGDIKSASVIIIVTILNAVLGTVQHLKAEQSLNSLKAYSTPIVHVKRNGAKVAINIKEVVVGDIILLEAGDYVPADARIIENYNLQINESSLTGESVSSIKTENIISQDEVAIGDQINMVFSGSLVTYGRAVAVVVKTGMNTEIGKIAHLLETAKEKKTPLQVNLDKFSAKLATIILAFCAVVMLLNYFKGYSLSDSFSFAIALAVAAIPEALSSIVTIVLAIGTKSMAKENAIIRKLHSVESLGCVSIICSDKTGTLTLNKMTVEQIYVDNSTMDISQVDTNDKKVKDLLEMCVLCNDASVHAGKEYGDPTEIALVNAALNNDIDATDVRDKFKRISELPFDSDRKLMSTLNIFENENIMITKGAVDVIVKRAKNIFSDGKIRPLEQSDIEHIELVNHNFSKEGLRVLAICHKTINESELKFEDEDNLTFMGLVAMIDPPRPESKKAVEACNSAGIKAIMITGDHKITAFAIAKKIGIASDVSEAVEGKEIDKISDEDLKNKVEKISVYARVSPEHKIRIVNAWQQRGEIVAMTGDGVNDAPAIKQADIGIAMGKVGTEVAKEAASMVLTDDNFATIVKAVKAGRGIYTNITNSIKFLLSGNMAGILAVVYTSVANLPLPFKAVHLLFINLLTDSMPAIALGLEPHRNDLMKDKPRGMDESIITKRFAFEILLEGAIIATCTILAFLYGLNKEGTPLGITMAFSTLSLARLVHGFSCRSKLPIYKIGLFTNKYQWMALITGVILLFGVLTIAPLEAIFDVQPSVVNELHVIIGFSLLSFLVIQIYKTIRDIFKI